MFEYMPWKKTVILKLSRDTAWSIQVGLTLLINKFIESSDAEEATIYSAIRSLIQAQLDEQEAKGGVET